VAAESTRECLTLYPRTWAEHLPSGGGVLDAVPQRFFEVSGIPVEAPEDAMSGSVESDGQRLDDADQLRPIQRPVGHPQHEPVADRILDQFGDVSCGHTPTVP
jgi:hypothetical protein